MSQLRCPYCGGSDGFCTTTSSLSPSSPFVKECKSCGRIVEEHCCEAQEIFVERAQDTPLCIVTPDFSDNDVYRTPPLEDDPFESIGFITAFSTWSLELSPLFTSTTSSFCGYLAELERVLLDPVCSPAAPSDNNTDAATSATVAPGSSSSMVDNLRAYFQILEVSSLLGLERDISDHAVQLFRDCSSTAYMRNRNVEALATAALVQASREAKEARTLQEISTAANVSQKEIHRYMKILTDALKLSQPVDSNSISVYMPRFCSILELEKPTQDLATHIGEVVMNKSFCTRRNPISISAAAIYLSCQLEDKRKTQTEICKATALTEVTLRKVYKELLENLNDLLPANYTPVIPPEKAFSVTGSNSNRVSATRGAVPGELDSRTNPLPEVSTVRPILAMDSPSLSRGRSGGIEISSGVAASCGQDSSENVVLGPVFFGCSNSMPKSYIRKSTAVSSNGMSLSVAIPSGICAAETSSVGQSTPSERVRERDFEWIKEGETSGKDPTEFKFSPPSKPDSFHHHFKFFEPFLPEVAPSSLPSQAAHGSSPVQIDADVGRKGSQVAAVSPVSMRDGAAAMSLPFLGSANEELIERDLHGTLEKDKVEARFDRQGDANSATVSQGASRYISGHSSTASASTTNTRSPVFQGFPQGMWGFKSASSTPQQGVWSQHWLAQCGDLLQGLPQGIEANLSSERGGKLGMEPDDLSSQSRGEIKLEHLPSGLAAPVTSSSAMQLVGLSHPSFWRPPLPHVYSLSADPNSLSGDRNGEVTGPPRRVTGFVDGVDSNIELPVTYSTGKVGINLSAPMPTADLLTKLSMGINSEMQTTSAIDGLTIQRSDESQGL